MRTLPLPLVLGALALGPLAACRPAAPEGAAPEGAPAAAAPVLRDRADSLAARLVASSGGADLWARVPYLRFNFGSGTPGEDRRPPRRHLWDRRTGAYRLEIPRGPDSVVVVLFNVGTKAGTASLAGAPLPDSVQTRWLERAYGAFINDTYWLLAPTKVFDPGVTRAYVADSADATHEVLGLTFAGVGLTPGDRYWLYVDRATGRLDAWRYHLQDSDGPGDLIRWTAYRALETPFGTAHLAEQHEVGGGRILYTDAVALPDTVDARLFTDPTARLD